MHTYLINLIKTDVQQNKGIILLQHVSSTFLGKYLTLINSITTCYFKLLPSKQQTPVQIKQFHSLSTSEQCTQIKLFYNKHYTTVFDTVFLHVIEFFLHKSSETWPLYSHITNISNKDHTGTPSPCMLFMLFQRLLCNLHQNNFGRLEMMKYACYCVIRRILTTPIEMFIQSSRAWITNYTPQ